MKALYWSWGILLLIGACDAPEPMPDRHVPVGWIAAVDISTFPALEAAGTVYKDANGQEKPLLALLTQAGINTVRLRLWVAPNDRHSGLAEVNALVARLRSQGLKTWLTIHYSDSWADPGQQDIPARWQGLGLEALCDSVYQYTTDVVEAIGPDYVQIGNEINHGLLHPQGHLMADSAGFLSLIGAGIAAVRDHAPATQIMLHYAGMAGAEWFFEQVGGLDYDLIGLSYYPRWHGNSFSQLQATLQHLAQSQGKKVVIAETAYPFTLDWNDFTDNAVGQVDQLILPDFPATPAGQRAFVEALRTHLRDVEGAIGMCYWGADWVAWKGPQATDGSPWENQALFDFDHRALPAMEELK